MRPVPYLPIIAIVLISVVTVEALSWSANPLRFLRKGRKEVERAEFRENLDRELPGAIWRLARRWSELPWWAQGGSAAAMLWLLARLGVDTRDITRAAKRRNVKKAQGIQPNAR